MGLKAEFINCLKKTPSHALSFEDVQYVFNFIQNFAEANAIILPGRTPYAWKSDCKLLPTECSRRFVYDKYVEAVSVSGVRKVSFRSFVRVWHDLLPFIKN